MAGSSLTCRVRPESGARTDSWACEVVIRASGRAVEQGAAKGLGSSPRPTGQIGAEAVILEMEGNRAPSHASSVGVHTSRALGQQVETVDTQWVWRAGLRV